MASSFPIKKNAAVKIAFPILDADGDPVSGAAGLDSEYSLDGGSFSDCSNEAVEIGSSGIYTLSLIAAETNGDLVVIQIKTSTSGAKTTVLVFYTAAQTLDEVQSSVTAVGAAVTVVSGKVDTIDENVDSVLEEVSDMPRSTKVG